MSTADCMRSPTQFINAAVVSPAGVIERGSVTLENGVITEVGANVPARPYAIDLGGAYLLPGFIDIHSDAIEKEIEARPGSLLPETVAIFEYDKKLAAAGVTTMYYSLCLTSNGKSLVRSLANAESIAREIIALRRQLFVRSRIHLRYEITDTEPLETVLRLVEEGLADLVSLMDHTPGQGQFRNYEQFKAYFTKYLGRSEHEAQTSMDERIANRHAVGLTHAVTVADACHRHGIRLASHDDDTPEKIEAVRRWGVTICEFPMAWDAIKAARRHAMAIVVGSPNIVRGASHNNNLNAIDIIAADKASIVCSDYIPATLLHALFKIVHDGILPLHEASKLFSANPADALGISDAVGTIEIGKAADLIAVNNAGPVPRLYKTIVGGKEVYSTCLG